MGRPFIGFCAGDADERAPATPTIIRADWMAAGRARGGRRPARPAGAPTPPARPASWLSSKRGTEINVYICWRRRNDATPTTGAGWQAGGIDDDDDSSPPPPLGVCVVDRLAAGPAAVRRPTGSQLAAWNERTFERTAAAAAEKREEREGEGEGEGEGANEERARQRQCGVR